MPKHLRALTLILIPVLTAAAAYAQTGPPGRWWHSPRVAKALNLTGDDIQRLESAFNQSRLKLIELKSRVETEQFKLKTLLESRTLDETAVKAQNRELEQARTALADERTAFVVAVRKIIGHQRFQQLMDMR